MVKKCEMFGQGKAYRLYVPISSELSKIEERGIVFCGVDYCPHGMHGAIVIYTESGAGHVCRSDGDVINIRNLMKEKSLDALDL